MQKYGRFDRWNGESYWPISTFICRHRRPTELPRLLSTWAYADEMMHDRPRKHTEMSWVRDGVWVGRKHDCGTSERCGRAEEAQVRRFDQRCNLNFKIMSMSMNFSKLYSVSKVGWTKMRLERCEISIEFFWYFLRRESVANDSIIIREIEEIFRSL